MTAEERSRIYSEDYISAIIDYNRRDNFIRKFEDELLIKLDDKYGIVYTPMSKYTLPLELENEYSYTPKLYGLLDVINLEEMGVTRVQNVPRLALLGEGVLLGFLDTGIDYQNSVFKSSDGSSRIFRIWDQTIENPDAPENIFYYGTEYTKEQINEALNNPDPYSVVPTRDEIGHGTMLAGIAGGSRDDANDFRGVVPSVEFAVVKLKQAKKNIRQHFFVPDDVVCYAEDDIMTAIKYLANLALEVNRPIVICIGLGTNQGSHDTEGELFDYVAFTGDRVGIAFVVAAGNEGNSRGHYFGQIDRGIGYNEVELHVGAGETGFSMELWGYAPNTYSIDITSPSGQYVQRMQVRLGESRRIEFLFENTIVYVDSILVESQTGSPLILVRFSNPAEGIWKFRVYANGVTNLNFHIWLPIRTFISPDTYFLNSNPDTTITSPGNGYYVTTVTAYNAENDTIYIEASRGYARNGFIKPNVAAPGVNVLAAMPENRYTRVSGTSVAAAHVTGLAAMMMEWGVVEGHYETMGSLQVQRFLMRGVDIKAVMDYPNNIWGYGAVNIYNTFLSLSSVENLV